MKKLSLKLLMLTTLSSTLVTQASELVTPLPLLYGFGRFPYEYFEHDKEESCFSTKHEKEGGHGAAGEHGAEHKECSHFKWMVDGLGYYRHASESFPTCGPRGCTVPYADLVFGISTPFLLANEFANGIAPVANNNPFLAFATINPLLDYKESGVIFNIFGESHFEYCDTHYRYGITFRLPVRDINITNECGLSDLVRESVADVYQQRNETTLDDPIKTNFVFAARLDFVSALNRVAIPAQPMVVYGDGTCANKTTIASQDVGFDCLNPAVVDVAGGNPSVALIARADGTMPSDEIWGEQTSATQPILQANGTGIPQNGRGRFNDQQDYATGGLAADVDAQSKLFVVPTLNGDNEMSTGALAIQSAINSALLSLPDSVFSFFESNGIDFCEGRSQGVGDLDVEFFIGRNWEYCEQEFWTDLKFVVRFPTAERLCNCKQILRQPLGNNKHWEVMGGFAGGWDINDRWKWMTDLTVSAVLKANEIVAAPFKGNSVKKIGPCITAQTHWWYLVYHTDISVFACEGCGFDVGYELFFKSIDKVCLFQNKAIDLFGVEQSVDPTKLMSPITQRMCNKMRVAIFSKFNNCEIFGGWSYAFAGYNAPKDMDWYLSFTAYF